MRHRRSASSVSPTRKRISSQFQSGTIILMVIITISFFILTLFTLFYHNRNATMGYKLKVLREERETQMFDIEILDRQIADVSAINTNKDSELQLDSFDKPLYKTKIIYLKQKTDAQIKREQKEQKQAEYEEELKKKRTEKEQKINNGVDSSDIPSSSEKTESSSSLGSSTEKKQ